MDKAKKVLIGGGVLVALAAVGSALGGGDESTTSAPPVTSEAAPKAAETTPETVAPKEQVGPRCLSVSELSAANLAEAADSKPGKVGAVKSPSSESYVVAIELLGGPTDGHHAVFETLSIEEAGMTKAVDGFARKFTKFPQSAFGAADQAAKDAVACMA